MTLFGTNGLYYPGMTGMPLGTGRVHFQEPLAFAPKLKLWQKARDMFKLRRKKNKQNFFPRPAKPERAVKPEEIQKAKEKIWAADIVNNMANCWKPPPPPEHKSPFDSGEAFAHFLTKKGFTKLGSGTYSIVLAKGDSNKVLKVCYRLDAWMDYISWAAKKGYCGTFAPRVYSYKYFKGHSSPFYVAVVERLHDECGRIDNKHPQAFTQKAFTWNSQVTNYKVAEILDVLQPGLKQFTFDFRDFITKEKHPVDYHGGNFMVRKDGSFVATDPIMGHQQIISTGRLRTKDFTLGPHFEAPLERLAA